MNFIRAYKNKITNKLSGVVHLPAVGHKKGNILLSYMTAPFTQAPGEHFTDPHTNYWECAEMARLYTERGYAVDVINASNNRFIPRKPYAAVIDVNKNLERLAPYLSTDCKKVLHITFSYGAFQNEAERQRLMALAERRGILLSPTRPEPLTISPAIADFLEGFGNSHVHSTYAQFGKTIFPIPISVAHEFAFPNSKNFATTRTHFLWFGGGGAVLKGLDLMLEAFAALPEYTLHIVGPSAYEPAFAEAFSKELSLPNIHRYPRPKRMADETLRIGDEEFQTVMNRCAVLLYPSASEGTSGAVIQAMHAGLIPVVTKETGIPDTAPVMLFSEASIPVIMATARAIAKTDPALLEENARAAWQYVRNHHTKKSFSEAYARFIDTTLFP